MKTILGFHYDSILEAINNIRNYIKEYNIHLKDIDNIKYLIFLNALCIKVLKDNSLYRGRENELRHPFMKLIYCITADETYIIDGNLISKEYKDFNSFIKSTNFNKYQLQWLDTLEYFLINIDDEQKEI